MVTRLTERQIRYAMGQRKNGRSASAIALGLKVGTRRIEQLWAEFCRTGVAHTPLRPGRKPSIPTRDETDLAVPDPAEGIP